ncbi:MAG TPA: ABC transporter ATP-binding protein [Sedimentisphaerales bacterium]|nr:ABC transporter ATP-binding protein [Sedimentisphaerales bacterium]HRS09838.1 ABC transporter ATP-binding protein [Sedimentisphaerales bacterium]HRV46512.1 ABC transporter ATP-binding protein [Sedimentisphaerales bacterium]
MATLEVESLTKRYGSARGVEDVTFAIEPGEIFGYLGPNGSGKTTTLRCIMGLLRPTSGQVRVLGRRVVAGRATEHARIGYLPGEFHIWPTMRSARSLKVLAALGGGARVAARRRQLAERFALDLSRRVADLSKGNRQKVGLVYAFQHEPEVLILDEPTAGLDPLMRQAALDLIRETAEQGATVLLSSHDLSEVAAVCGRAGILREGRLVEVAPIAQIVQSSEHRLTVWFGDGHLAPRLPEGLAGVRVVKQKPGVLDLAYQGQADPVLKWLSRFAVERIATPQMSLEDAFIQYYREPSEGSASRGRVASRGGDA